MQERIKRWTRELMMIPGLSGFEGPVRRYIRGELSKLGIESRADMLGNLIATVEGDTGLPSVMLIAHMDQLGLIVRKIEASGLIRAERVGGVPERALAAQEVLLSVGGGRTLPGIIANKSHHATTPEEKYRVVPYQELYIDCGFASAGRRLQRASMSEHPSSIRPTLSNWRVAASAAPRSMTAPPAP